MNPIARLTGTILLTAFLVLALAIAVEGAFQTRRSIAESFSNLSQIQQAQLDLEELLRLQIVEENSLRGYSLTLDPFYLGQYRAAGANLDAKERSIRATLSSQDLLHAQSLLNDYAGIQDQWRREIAAPLMRPPRGARASDLDRRNKIFTDYEAKTVGAMRIELAAHNEALAHGTQAQFDRSSYVRTFWLLLFGLLAILFNAYRSRLDRELEEERTTTSVLQRAFQSESVPLPGCDIGSVYQAASSHLAVGGDVFDVYRLSDKIALLLIADVSGKGVDAAVITAFIKFTIRGIALRRREPGAILAEFNTAFSQAVENPYLFVSMFVGILDTETFTLRYASAGHDSAFLRRSQNVQQLAVTGPVLGVMEEPFETRTVRLQPGDALVLSTDGLTEARHRNGEFLHDEGAMRLIASGSQHAQQLADDLVAGVRAIGGNHLRDDLAILVICVNGRDGSKTVADA
jgi:sigma-B regulation protein RsbU (phosphoserine phosphatase)